MEIRQKKDCTGCRACGLICPVNCITYESDDEGFLVPLVDEDKCIECKLCLKRCPQNKELDINNIKGTNSDQKVFALKLKSEDELYESASGGGFSAIAKSILNQGGIVFGCAFNEKVVANHKSIKSVDELYLLKSSKYVQSDTNDTFDEAKIYLDEGKKVLYSGTPCQIAGLYAYLNKDYENLITVDLVCHGVPSPGLFSEYIKSIEEENKQKVTNYNFRYKGRNGHGLSGKCIKIQLENKCIKKMDLCDSYCRAFLKGVCSRECCYRCKYANTNRIADITLGDFWGIEIVKPEVDTSKGISVFIANSDKGKNMIPRIEEYAFIYESNINEAKSENYNLNRSSKRPELRDSFYKDVYSLGYTEAVSKYVKTKGPIVNYFLIRLSRKNKLRLKKIKRMMKVK